MAEFEKILAVYSGIYTKKRLFSTSVSPAKLVLCEEEVVFLENDKNVKQFDREECLQHRVLWELGVSDIDSIVLSKTLVDPLVVHVQGAHQQSYDCTINQSDYRNIGRHLDTMGVKWRTENFRYGKDTFDSVPKQYQEPPKEKDRKDVGEVCRFKGLRRKKIIVYEDYVLLTFSGGDSKITIHDITKVDYRACTKNQIGYIRLRYPGSDARKKPENDDSSILWDDVEQNASAQQVKNTIEQKVAAKSHSRKQSSAFSVADEIMKLKELLDAGIINQDEFDRQKEKLLK